MSLIKCSFAFQTVFDKTIMQASRLFSIHGIRVPSNTIRTISPLSFAQICLMATTNN